VADGETGSVVAPKDVDAVRDAIARLIADDALRTRMGEAARVRAASEFSYDVLVDRLRPVAAGRFDALEPLALPS
jgi:glycosyltransferase involved in cell wall biosynthesis